MTLIKCEECGAKISDKAASCPKCGCPIEKKDIQSKVKLTAAKCPECGANIDVDKNENKAKCKYCNSTIIVEDAIERLKIELSGEVEVKNLPKLEGILRVGDRHYKNGEYDEAYNQYSTAVTLDSDNSLAILRKGISKSLMSSYSSFDITSAANGYKDALNIEKDIEKKHQYMEEILGCIYILQCLSYNTYYSLKNINNEEIRKLISRLELCNEVYETILPSFDTNDFKKRCYAETVNNYIAILSDKFYNTGKYNNGHEISAKYILKNDYINKTEEKIKNIIKEIKIIDSALANELNEKFVECIFNNIDKKREKYMLASLVIGIIGLSKNKIFFGIILLINALFLDKKIFKSLCKDKIKDFINLSEVITISITAIMILSLLAK